MYWKTSRFDIVVFCQCMVKMGMKKMNDKRDRIHLKREVGELRKELRTREATAIAEVLKRADVVLATNTGE